MESSGGPSEVLQAKDLSQDQFIINDLNNGWENMFMTFADGMKLEKTASVLGDSFRIQRALEELDRWSK